VRFCAAAGISQFLDIGSGLPTMESVHHVAQRLTKDARVVYVDSEPVVVSHSRALLANPRTLAIQGNLTRPDEILGDPAVQGLIDFSKPVAILLVAILHFIPDTADPAGSVARLRDIMAPGSFLVLTGQRPRTEAARELGEARKRMPAGQVRNREDILPFFGDLTLVEPGLTDVWAWRPDDDAATVNSSDVMTVLGGVARKD
jgi:hypothetical protein